MSDLFLKGVTKNYGGTVALAGIDLDVASGEFVSLLGPSGCGKSTTLRIVAGFVQPDDGDVYIGGQAMRGVAPHKRNVGVVFQNYALFPHMTTAANVGFGLRMRSIPARRRAEMVDAALTLVGLAGLGERYPGQMSGGQQQRVALARAIVIEPKLLLLDEPLSNLDAGLRAEMRDEISRLQSRLGITTIFVTHDQSEALAMSDRIVVMQDGHIVETATPELLSDQPSDPFTARFLGARTVLPGHTVNGGSFVIDNGPTVECDAPDAATHIVLRASRLGLVREQAAAGANRHIAATVRRTVYLGDTQQIVAEAGGTSILVVRPTSEPMPVEGAPVWLTLAPEAVTFLKTSQRDGIGATANA